MIYRIYTESTGGMRTRAVAATAAVFDCFTVIDTKGYWQGTEEDSMIIEIISDKDSLPLVFGLANHIKSINAQDSVLVTSHKLEAELV